MKRIEIVELIKETLWHIAPGAKTILYGSEARGDAIAGTGRRTHTSPRMSWN